MAHPSTADTQKVFNSATQDFISFVGGVDGVSPSSKNIQIIYDNLAKLFDVFTQGVLTGQGANSELLLRMIYRSLDQDYLKIFQDSDLVENLIEIIKSKQEGEGNNTDEGNAQVSNNPTKNIVLKKPDSADDIEPMKITEDFLDEIQESMLQLKQNLQNEYQRRQQELRKRIKGQEQDLKTLNDGLASQGQETIDSLANIKDESEEWKTEQTDKIDDIEDKLILIQDILDQADAEEEKKKKDDDKGEKGKEISSSPKQKTNDTVLLPNQPTVVTNTTINKEILRKTTNIITDDNNKSIIKEKLQIKTQIVSKDNYIKKNFNQILKLAQSVDKRNKLEQNKFLMTTSSLLKNNKQNIDKISGKGGDKNKENKINGGGGMFGKMGAVKAKNNNTYDNKISINNPSKPNGKTAALNNKNTKQPTKDNNEQQNNTNNQSKITQSGVLSTLSKIEENVGNKLKDEKFRNAFTPNYKKIQSAVGKQMKNVEKDEKKIERNIFWAKLSILWMKIKAKKDMLFKMLFGGITQIAIISLGALIIIGLIRAGLSKWAQTYMPQNDGSEFSIFGIKIPGFSVIKQISLGIYNFVRYGLRNWVDRLLKFINKTKTTLFGQKGIAKDAPTVMANLKRIGVAWLLGLTKKVGGMILKLIFKVCSFIPFVGPVFAFLEPFAAEIYVFVLNQITKIMAENKVKAEQAAKDSFLDQLAANGTGQHKIMRKIVTDAAKGISLFKGQAGMEMYIPNMQTSKGENGQPKKKAIMRHVPLNIAANAKSAKKLQESKVEERKKQFGKELEERSEANPNSLLNQIITQNKKIVESANKFQKDYKRLKKEGKISKGSTKDYELQKHVGEMQKKLLVPVLLPQVRALDAYINALSKSTRFKNVKGPLYDVETGWNPGYRVYAADLMSIIPTNPFEEIHKKADVPIGVPAEAETTSHGFMPFTWINNGAKVSVHPILFELARAKAIRKIFVNLLEDSGDLSWWGNSREADLTKHALHWEQWNNALVKHDIGSDFLNRKEAIFGDKFSEFIKKFRNGELTHEENTFEKATEEGSLGNFWKAAKFGVKAATGVAQAEIIADFTIKKAKQAKRVLGYDKNRGTGIEEGDNIFKRMFKRGKAAFRVATGLSDFKEFRKIELGGITYGKVRDIMFDDGLLDFFSKGSIMSTINSAIPILNLFFKNKLLLEKEGFGDKKKPISYLMNQFFKFAEIQGYRWENAKNDQYAQAAFSQSFLEYIKYRVLPLWNSVESKMSFYMSQRTPQARKVLITEIEKLLISLTKKESLLGFMKEHLRFPNMQIRVVDYSNAKNSTERKRLDEYRKALGIPDKKEKLKIIQSYEKPSNDDIDKQIKKLQSQIKKAEFEARFSGDYSYANKLKAKLDDLMKRKQAQSTEKKANGVVKKAGDIKTNVVEPKVDEKALEEERKKKELEEKRKEEERKKKEKEEREKKLKEEAKRKQELVIAQAKIKAMEAIRKQEENYETILSKLINDPGSVTEKDFKSLGKDVEKIKQEAENKIGALPREEREMKLALIRGDKISQKTFTEIKETAVGLHGNLKDYMDEVKKIPTGSVMAINNTPAVTSPTQIRMQDSDSVDMGGED